MCYNLEHLCYHNDGQMRHEDWIQYQSQEEQVNLEKFGKVSRFSQDKAFELRTEVDALVGRLKAELLAELGIEIERLIAMETANGNGDDHLPQKRDADAGPHSY